MLRSTQHDNAPLNILLLYNIKSFLEETEFPTEREKRYEKKCGERSRRVVSYCIWRDEPERSHMIALTLPRSGKRV